MLELAHAGGLAQVDHDHFLALAEHAGLYVLSTSFLKYSFLCNLKKYILKLSKRGDIYKKNVDVQDTIFVPIDSHITEIGARCKNYVLE